MSRRVVRRSTELLRGHDEPDLTDRPWSATPPPSGLSRQAANVLAAILYAPGEESYGYEIAEYCGSPPGSIYRVLPRLVAERLVELHVEDEATARAEGRPVRKLYRLTSEGEEMLARWRTAEILSSPASRLLS